MDLPMRQSLLLGAYLAHREDWVGRDELLGVFWPEEDETTARHNLSQLVYHCKRQPWFEALESERTRLRWRIDTDLQLFRAALGAGAWHDALTLYRGPLLEGLPTGVALGFETWLERERETLHGAWRDAVLEVAAGHEREGRWSDAVAHLRQVLAQDALAEDALQAYLRCAGPAGQREAALRTYEAFRARLRSELDMAPLDATVVLARSLLRSDAGPESRGTADAPADVKADATEAAERLPASDTVRFSVAGSPPGLVAGGDDASLRNVPAHLSPFVGRHSEREQLGALLANDGARLVTLTGPGGSGKTRLAVEVARHVASAFQDGAVFVPLAEVLDPQLVAHAFLDALELQAPAGREADAYLLEWLAPRSLLLVVDNLEHLLDGAGLVSELLEASSGSAVLVTSREPLDVQGEVLFDVLGLDYPTSDRQPIDGFDAVILFVRCALRAHARFVLSPADRAGVVRICRLLEGMPLGIELAAAWMRRLRPVEVADGLELNLDMLATTHREVPPRQRSVRATLDHSWALLSDEERSAWTATSVFLGGFDKSAAGAVTGTSLRTLLALANKSLLSRTGDGRFEQLAVVRQYGHERSLGDPARRAAVAELHAEYYAGLVAQGVDLAGEGQAEWLSRLSRDHKNLGAALEHYRCESREEAGLQMANGALRYWWLRGHYQEARDVFSALLSLSADRTAVRAKALSNAGSVARLCEDLDAARDLLQESIDIQRELGDPEPLAATIGTLGNLIRLRGEYQESERLLLECLELYRRADNHHMVANTLNNLGVLATFRDDAVAAERWYQEAYELATRTGEELVSALALGNLGRVAVDRRDWERARRLYGDAYVVFERLGYQVGLAVTDQSLGDLALGAADTVEASRRYQRAARRFADLGDQRGIGEVLASTVAVALARDDPRWALRCVGASRALHQRLGFVPPVAALDDLERQSQQALELLGEAQWAACLEDGARLAAEEMLNLVAVPAP